MSYTALYRKFRPNTFEDVKGQEHIVTTLKNQIKADRIGHAYLFCGTRGTGKTSVAKIFAKAVNCEHPAGGNPCGECAVCKSIAAGVSMNVMEIDAASNNGVDNIRDIVEDVSYSPAEGKYKVYIIDEVHMLSIGAFNALLKTLEEPPAYVIFILATTEVHKIPITILSRCQRYDFRRITIDTISERLNELMATENVQVEEKAIRYIAKVADGSLRDALSLLDQCIAFHFGQELTYDMVLDVLGAVDNGIFSELLRLVLGDDVLGCINLLEKIVIQGRELTQFVVDFTWYLRNLLLVKSSDNIEDVIDVSTDNLEKLKEEAQKVEIDTIMRYIRIFSELSGKIRFATQKRILIEMTLVKLCRPSMETTQDAILDRIRQLEEKVEKGIVVTNVSGAVGNSSASVAKATREQKPRPQLERAVPEDVKQMVKKWGAIVNSMAQPAKVYLKGADLSLGGENRLLIVLKDGVASDYFIKSPENVELLEQHISNFINKKVEVEFQSIREDRNFDDTYVDLKQIINMDIEEEEDIE